MRKTLLSALLMVFLSVAAYAAKEDLYVLHADFEEGTSLPEGWTMESVFGDQSWVIEQGEDLIYPVGSAQGKGRIALRNTTTQTQRFVTRLITPAMDLSELTAQPMLIFSHAQPQRAGDVDVLRVYYRTALDGRWVQIAQYDKKVTNWQADTLYLDGYNTKTYQIAFEGEDRFGRGIVLDEIIVRPDIVCEDARDIRVNSLSGTDAVIEWGGSLDTDSFEVVVSKVQLNSEEDIATVNPEDIIAHTFVSDFQISLKELEINTKYYIYIKAYCPSLEGQWVGGLIKTLNRVQLPFVEHFDAPFNKDNPSQTPNWTYGTSMREDDGVTMRALPYLTNYRTESMWKNYSPNATPALEFASAINAKVLPAGEYAYAASPEIDIENIQDAYIDFWATCYLYYPEYSSDVKYAAGIIVGIMENPTDYSTFVPVDTCYAINGYKFEQFRVKFDKYTGKGKYVAFASDFKDEVTLFWVDEVTIGNIKEPVRPMNFTVNQFTPTSAVVAPELYDATAWNVIVSDIKTDDPDKLKPANILVKIENIPASKKDTLIQIANMEGKWVRFYVQAVQGEKKSEWSASQKYMMPNSLASSALPKTWDFETKGTISYEQIWEYTSQTPGTLCFLQDGLIQHVANYADGYRSGSSTESYAHGGSYTYHLNKRDYRSPYLVFPQLDSLKNKMFTFFYSQSSTGSQPYYQVGVMTDPQDTATFVPVKTYSDAEYQKWGKGELLFLDYTGDARYIAIRLIDGPNTVAGKMAYGCIDDVTISVVDDCIKPLNVEAVAEDSAITITWDANGMTKWAVAVSENWENEKLFMRDTVTTNLFTIDTLKPHTTYTYQITTLVGAKKATSDIFTIKTQCAPYELIPYKEGFEDAPTNTSLPEVPNCWTIPQFKYTSSSSGSAPSSTYYYPHAYNSSSSAHSGNVYLQLGYSSIKDSMYAALPRLEKDLRLLQMSFYIRGISSYVNDTLYVGVMSDPNDFATFDTVYTFTVTGMEYKEHIVNLSSYAGQGNYLAFYKPVTNHYYMIDDVEVKELPACEKVFNVKAKNIVDNGATFSWYKKDASKWQFVVATKDNLTAKQIDDKDKSIVMDSIIEVNPFVLADDTIKANKQYYAYIRAVCDGANYGDWSDPAAFKTVCTARGIDDFGGSSKVEDFSQSSTSDCWKFGDRVGSGTHNILNGHIQLINSSASTDGAYAIARKLNIDSLQYLQVTFDAWNSTSTYPLNEVTVGIITNPEDLSTFVPLDVVKFKMAADADDHEAYTVRFNEYMGDYNEEYGQFVMFISESGENSNKIELDNIYFDSISAYLEPLDIWADSIGENAIKLHWENTKADSYEYKYSDKLTTLGAATPVAVDADSALISGLAMLKTYYVQVRAKYGENYSRWSNWRQFATECPASQKLPWAENFDTGSSSTSYKNTPQCWGAFGSDGTVGSDCITPTVYNSAKKDGVGGLYIGGSKTVASYTILPRFDADLSKAILAFEYKLHTYSSSYEDSLWIGVAKNVENLDSLLNSVIWIDQMVEKRTTSAANVWTKYQKKLEGAGDAQYIVLKAKSTYTTYTTSTKYGFYIDNMSVEPEASCNKPEAPVAVLRDLNGLGFSWTDTIASNWDAVALPKGDAPDENTTPAVTVDTTYAFISGLQPKTEYDLYVRANCGAGDVSYWVGPVSMKTLSAAAYPFFTDFEAEPTELTPGNSTSYKIHEGWISGLGKGTSASYYPYVRQDPTATTSTWAYSYGHDESHSRALYMQAYSATIDSAFIVLPALYDNAANAPINLDTVQIRFQARMMTSGIGTKDKQIPNFLPTGGIVTGDPSSRHQKVTNQRVLQIGTVSNPMDIKTFQLIDAFELAPVLSAKDTVMTDEDPRGNNWWEEISVPMTGAKGKYIAILYPYATTSSNVNIDNVYVEKAVGLYAPNAVKGVASSKNSITITWTNRFNAPKIDVGYVAAGGALSELTIVTTDKDTLEITGLDSNKQYDFYVRANDGAGKTSNWSAGTILATRYVVDLADASWDFDRKNNYVSPKTGNLLPLGWIVGSKYATSNSYIPKLQFNTVNTTTLAVTTAFSRQKVARNGALYIQSFVSSTNNSDGAYAIMPQINGDLENKELHFWARACAMTISSGTATQATSATYATAAYPRAIKVGYVTDPDNIESFVELADIQLPALSSSTAKATEDASGNEFWNEISVPLKGIGEGKYITFLSEYGNTNNIWIDQIDFRDAGSVCHTPNRLTQDSLGAHAAKFSWQLGEGQWAILLSTTKNSAQVIRDTVTSRAYSNDTLLANTSYIFKVKKVCSELDESAEVSIEFTTDCDPYDKDKASWSFSDKLVDMKIGTTTNKVPECWTLDLGVRSSSSYASYCPKAEPNTSSVILAKEATKATTDRALQFYTTTSNYNAYAVLPPLDVNRDSTILHFFGRAARFNKTFNSTNKTFLNAINNGYLRKLVVGTMSDPNNFETFVAVDTITYDHVWPVLKESNLTQDSLNANNEYWQEYILDLKKYKGGEFIAILAPKPEATSYFYIDELSIMDAETCTEISSVIVNDITKTSATLNWTIPQGVENFYLEVSTDKDFEDTTKFVVRDTVQALSYNLTSLKPATEYFARIKHICSEQKQSEFTEKSFTTLYAIRFTEQFTEQRSIPANWSLYNYKDMQPTNTNSWERKSNPDDDNMYGPYMSSYLMGSWKRWLATPQIDLSDVAAADSIALSFDMTITNPAQANEDSVFFLVLISTDGGLTYPEENRTVWGTTADCDYPFSAISNKKKGTRWFIDLSKFNGQVIRIMFGTDVYHVNVNGYLYLDNVQLNYYTKSENEASICQWTDYADKNFTIDAENLKVGQTTLYQKFTQNVKENEKDALARLTLTVTPMVEEFVEATICEGTSYMEGNFEIAKPKSGTYRQKLQGVNTCDSIVTLNLTVLSKQYETVEKTICQGTYFEFNGEKYYTNTIVSDTLSGSNGCDSIVTLYLTVNPILVGEMEEVFLCPGVTYNFSEKYPELSVDGIYKDTIRNALGCDSVISVEIKNVPSESKFFRAAICQGEVYNNDVFAGLSRAGDYPSAQKTVYGCDSIVTLHLLVAQPTEQQTFAMSDGIAVEDLPYVLNGVELLPVGTVDGIYIRTIDLGCGEVTLTIAVGDAQGINNVNASGTIARKLLVNGNLYIICNDEWYNAEGKKVTDPRK